MGQRSLVAYFVGLLSKKESYSLAQLREELASFEGDVFAEDRRPEFPTRWKSLTSGTELKLRFQGDYISCFLMAISSDGAGRMSDAFSSAP